MLLAILNKFSRKREQLIRDLEMGVVNNAGANKSSTNSVLQGVEEGVTIYDNIFIFL